MRPSSLLLATTGVVLFASSVLAQDAGRDEAGNFYYRITTGGILTTGPGGGDAGNDNDDGGDDGNGSGADLRIQSVSPRSSTATYGGDVLLANGTAPNHLAFDARSMRDALRANPAISRSSTVAGRDQMGVSIEFVDGQRCGTVATLSKRDEHRWRYGVEQMIESNRDGSMTRLPACGAGLPHLVATDAGSPSSTDRWSRDSWESLSGPVAPALSVALAETRLEDGSVESIEVLGEGGTGAKRYALDGAVLVERVFMQHYPRTTATTTPDGQSMTLRTPEFDVDGVECFARFTLVADPAVQSGWRVGHEGPTCPASFFLPSIVATDSANPPLVARWDGDGVLPTMPVEQTKVVLGPDLPETAAPDARFEPSEFPPEREEDPSEDEGGDGSPFPGSKEDPVETGPHLVGGKVYSNKERLVVRVQSITRSETTSGCTGSLCLEKDRGPVSSVDESDDWQDGSPVDFKFAFGESDGFASSRSYRLVPVRSTPDADGLYEYDVSYLWKFDREHYAFFDNSMPSENCTIYTHARLSTRVRLLAEADDGDLLRMTGFGVTFPAAGHRSRCIR